MYLDSPVHSYTVDGLPTLKIQTLNEDSLQGHKRSQTLPIFIQRLGSGRKSSHPEFTAPKVNYTQVSLEEDHDDEKSPTVPNEMTFKPVLIWKPRRKKSSRKSRPLPDGDGSAKFGTRQISAAENSDVDPAQGKSPSDTRKTLCKTNLTDTLLPYKEAQQAKVGEIYFGAEINSGQSPCTGLVLCGSEVWFQYFKQPIKRIGFLRKWPQLKINFHIVLMIAMTRCYCFIKIPGLYCCLAKYTHRVITPTTG